MALMTKTELQPCDCVGCRGNGVSGGLGKIQTQDLQEWKRLRVFKISNGVVWLKTTGQAGSAR